MPHAGTGWNAHLCWSRVSTLDLIPSTTDFHPSRSDRNPGGDLGLQCEQGLKYNRAALRTRSRRSRGYMNLLLLRKARPRGAFAGVRGGYGISFTTALTSVNWDLYLLFRIICRLTSAAAARPHGFSAPRPSCVKPSFVSPREERAHRGLRLPGGCGGSPICIKRYLSAGSSITSQQTGTDLLCPTPPKP